MFNVSETFQVKWKSKSQEASQYGKNWHFANKFKISDLFYTAAGILLSFHSDTLIRRISAEFTFLNLKNFWRNKWCNFGVKWVV